MNNQVKHFVIDDEFEITERMLELNALNPERSVLAVGYYETIISIVNDLLKCSDDLFMIEAEIMPPEFDGYEEGFYCEVSDDEVFVGRTHWEGQDKMKIFEADITFCEEDFVDDYVVRNGVDGLVVVVGEVLVREGGGVAGHLTLGEQPGEESLAVEVLHLGIEPFQVRPHLAELVVAQVRFHELDERGLLPDGAVVADVVHQVLVAELLAELPEVGVGGAGHRCGDTALVASEGLVLDLVVQVQPFVHGVEAAGRELELPGLV